METPIRVELAKLSHVHALGLLLPFVPGIVVTLGLTLGHSSIAQQFSTIALGYNTRLAVVVALTYIIGLAMMAVTQNCTGAIMTRIRPTSKAGPWNNSYWRRVAAAYLGSSLLPDCASASVQDLDTAANYVLAVAGKQNAKVPLSSVWKRFGHLFETLKRANDSQATGGQANRDALANASQRTAEIKGVLEENERRLRTEVTEYEWLSLYNALEFLPADVQSPYESLKMLMGCLQATAIGSVLLMIQFRELRDPVMLFFATILFLVTSWGLWLNFIMDRYFADFGSRQTSFMLQQLRQRSEQKASPESK